MKRTHGLTRAVLPANPNGTLIDIIVLRAVLNSKRVIYVFTHKNVFWFSRFYFILDKKPKVLSTQEVEEKVARHMRTVKEKAEEEAKRINLPGYLNPAMVNVHQFKQVQDKRKLLWSKTKDKVAPLLC